MTSIGRAPGAIFDLQSGRVISKFSIPLYILYTRIYPIHRIRPTLTPSCKLVVLAVSLSVHGLDSIAIKWVGAALGFLVCGKVVYTSIMLVLKRHATKDTSA